MLLELKTTLLITSLFGIIGIYSSQNGLHEIDLQSNRELLIP